MSDQPGIHDQTFSQVSDERKKAAKQLGILFEVFPERKQAFEDLLRLCSDRDSEVREEAINSLEMVFPNVPDRELTWERFVNLTAYPSERVMKRGVNALIAVFPLMPDKTRAWNDLAGMVKSKSSMEDVSRGIVRRLPDVLPELPNKEQAWKDLLEMTVSDDSYVREKAASFLSMVFPEIPEDKKNDSWDELLELADASADSTVRALAAKSIEEVFPVLPEEKKDEAWEEVLELAGKTADQAMQKEILLALPSVFSSVPDKKVAWGDLFRLTGDESGAVRKQAVDTLVSVFPEMPDSILVWADFLRLTGARDDYVRDTAADTLSAVFPGLKDKDSVWEELLKLTGNEDEYVRRAAADTLSKVFPHVSDKNQAYSDLVQLTEKKDSYVLRRVVKTLASVYPQFFYKYETNEVEEEENKEGEIEEKEEGAEKWKHEIKKTELGGEEEKSKPAGFYKLASEKAAFVRRDAANSLGAFFPGKGEEREAKGEIEARGRREIESKQGREIETRKPAFNLLKLTGDRDRYVRKDAAESFARAYPYLPDKKEVIEKLLSLIQDPDLQMRRGAIEYLLAIYSRKAGGVQDIWSELLKMSGDRDTDVRKRATELISHVFPEVEEKSGVFFDLVKLSESQDSQLRKRAAELLPVAFIYTDNKQRAWNDLLRLSSVEDREVRKGAVLAIASGFADVPDKGRVWSDLIRLSNHSDSFVQRAATRALGPAFFQVPDKTRAWRDLQVLIDSPYVYVRRYALRSLGRASLWRALRAENEAAYLFGFKEAVKYFKEAAETLVDTSLPELYSPFYESLLRILFSDSPERTASLESGRYFSKAVHEIRDLEENQELLEILEELAGLLQAAGNLTPGDLLAQKKLLEKCIAVFDRASGMLDALEEDFILVQKSMKKEYPRIGNVVLEQKLKETLSGIRYRARTACLQAKGTPAEKITCMVSQKVREWDFQDIDKDRKELYRQLDSLLNVLRAQVPYLPENQYFFEKLEDIRQEQDLLERYRRMGRLIGLIPGVRMPKASGR
ncbi:hypothetical protein MSSAC_2914 [Methanosarcina siciliae C2J]|uniref:Phosphorylase n=1 Tax=Methanosarcina siciliae C2J TaxID=1434118 RepID=A0A0E3PR49_9EURY|nr:HEAT repeat domain-containing protein [Methanosarcina siciliae]AKB37504.1 hypothetical protein MSSAC_2914 [Methanosarcina siciliae C2J]